MSKKLDIDTITNDLEGSAFFRSRQPDGVGVQQNHSLPTGRPPGEATVRPAGQLTTKRTLVRRGFEFGDDQLAALKKLSLQEQLEGREGSMSAMVRGALDDYFKKRSL